MAPAQAVDATRWLLRCPVDQAWIAPGVDECPDCGLSTGPLRALASVAADNLETAASVSPRLAASQVEAASSLVPESENFLMDAGRALAAAGAYDEARDALERASKIAPGRKDIKAELAAVAQKHDPTAWLQSGPADAAASVARVEQVPRPSRPAPRLTFTAELQRDGEATGGRPDEVELRGAIPRRAMTVIMPFGRPAKTYLVPVARQETAP